MYGASRGQKSVLDLLELDWQRVVSLHVGAGIWTWIHWRSSQYSWLLSHLFSPNSLVIRKRIYWDENESGVDTEGGVMSKLLNLTAMFGVFIPEFIY